MIKVENGNISIEGQLGDLMIDAARILDAVASAVERKAGEDEVDYDFVINSILKFVEQVKKISASDNVWGYEDELQFLQEARDLRNKHHGDKDFIDYDSGSADPKTESRKKKTKAKARVGDAPIISEIEERNGSVSETTSITGGAKLGDYIIDSRSTPDDLMDIGDLKAIKGLQKKHKR